MTRAENILEKAGEYLKQASRGASKIIEHPHAGKAALGAGIAAAGYAAGKAVGKARHRYGSVRDAMAAPGRRRKAAELRSKASETQRKASELEDKATPHRGRDEDDDKHGDYDSHRG